jgi:hypothetical protein
VSEILLGYKIPTGEEVNIPVRHMCVTGQTQESKVAYEEAQTEIEQLKKRLAELELMISNRHERKPSLAAVAAPPPSNNSGREEVAMALERKIPVIDVTVRKYVIEADDTTLRGRLAVLISQNFFDAGATGNSAFNELKRRGFGTAKPNVYRELDKLAEFGFVTKEGGEGYKSVPGMKVNVKEVSAIA